MYIDFETIELASAPSFESELDLKEWVWKHEKDQILNVMRIRKEKASLQQNEADFSRRLLLLDHVARIQRRYLLSEDPKAVYGSLLDSILKLSGSEYGFIGEVEYGHQGQVLYMQTHAYTDIAWDEESRKLYRDSSKKGLRFYNMKTLFGSVIRTKQPVISNQPRQDGRSGGLPKGHPPLDYFLGIPFFRADGTLLGLVGLANKPGGYSQADIEFLEPFTLTCSNLIYAYQHFQKSEQFINTLEVKVEERTLELQAANERLSLANQQQLKHFAYVILECLIV